MKKRLASFGLALAMTVSLLSGMTLPAAAAGNSQFDSIVNLGRGGENDAPADFDAKSTENPYGTELYEPFSLNQEMELLLYQTFDYEDPEKARHWTTWYDGFDMSSIAAKGSMSLAYEFGSEQGAWEEQDAYNYTEILTYSYVEAVAFDPGGTGRKNYVAYVGFDAVNNDVVLWVRNASDGTRSPIFILGSAKWLTEPHAAPDQYRAGNFFAITAGQYSKTDPKEHIVVYACLDGGEKLLEYSYDSGQFYYVQDARLGYLHGDYVTNTSMCLDSGTNGRNRLGVDLDTGDFNGDGVDDLVVLSYLNAADNQYRKLHVSYYGPQLSVAYGTTTGRNAILATSTYSEKVWQSRADAKEDKDWYDTVAAPSLATGDTDGDGRDDIVVAGYTNVVETQKGDNRYYAEDSFTISESKLRVAVYRSGSNLAPQRTLFAETDANAWTSGGLEDTDAVLQPLAVECVAVNGKGNPAYLFIGGSMYQAVGEVLSLSFTPEYLTNKQTGAGSPNQPTDLGVDRTFIPSVAVGNFDGNDVGREQVVFVLGAKQSSERDYFYRLAIIGGTGYSDTKNIDGEIVSYGTTTTLASNDIGKEYYVIFNKGDAVLDKRVNCVVVAADIDHDGLLARYVGKKYTYSDPAVQAVLQAAPYFEELGGYDAFNNGATTYSMANSYSYGTSDTYSYSYGLASVQEVSAPGIKIAMERGYMGGWSESFEQSLTTTYETSFAAGSEDTVVIQRTPVFIYLYEIQKNGQWPLDSLSAADKSDENKGADALNESTIQITVPKPPVFYSMTVDGYNDFADYYNDHLEGLAKLSGSTVSENAKLKKLTDDYLIDNEGNPWAYRPDWGSDSDSAECLTDTSTTLSLGYGGGSQTSSWSRENSTTEGYEYENGFSFNMTVAVGGMLVVAEAWGGWSASFEFSVGHGAYTTEAKSTGTSGTVANIDGASMTSMGIPQSVYESYKFNWTFGKWDANLGAAGDKVPIFGYALSGIGAPVGAVKDLTAVNVGEGAVLLSWSAPAGAESGRTEAAGYHVYQQNASGGYDRLTGAALTDTEYRIDNLKTNTPYVFVVTSLDEVNDESVWSNQAAITTLKGNYTLSWEASGAAVTATYLGATEIKNGSQVQEENLIYVEIAPEANTVLTQVSMSVDGGAAEPVPHVDGKFNFVLRGDTVIYVNTAATVISSVVSYTEKYYEGDENTPLKGTVRARVGTSFTLDPSGGTVTGTAVTFEATPEEGYALYRWHVTNEDTGEVSRHAAAGETTLILYPYAAAHHVTAEFVPESYDRLQRYVTVTPSEGGTVEVRLDGQLLTPDPDGKITVPVGSDLTLAAVADDYYLLRGWTGDLAEYKDDPGPISWKATDNLAVGAEFFAPLKYTVTFSAVPESGASGTLTAAISGGSPIQSKTALVPGTDIEFVARAGSGSRLCQWAVKVGAVTSYLDRTALTTQEEYVLKNLSANSDVQAHFKAVESFTLAIETPENGTITVTRGSETLGSGDTIHYGDVLTIAATPNSSYYLSGLTVNSASFASGMTHIVTDDVAVQAAFAQQSSGTSGVGGGGALPTEPTPSTPTATETIQVTPSASGTVSSATVPESTVNSAVDRVLEQAQSSNAAPELKIQVNTPDQAESLELTLPTAALKGLSSHKEAALTVTSGVADVTMDSAALAAVAAQAGSQVTLLVVPVEKEDLTQSQREAVGDAPVYDITLLSGNTAISDLRGGRISVTIPYTLAQGQSAEGLVVYFLDDEGGLHPCETTYANGKLTFSTDHLSKYAVLYSAAAVFTDVARGDYFFDAVAWAAEQGITDGTSASTFSPHASCTRAQVATFLWRASGSPEPAAAASPFTDVAAGDYFWKAVLWAYEQGITTGTSPTTFGPDETCTRAQIVTFLWRAGGAPAVTHALDFTDVAPDAWYAGAVRWAAAGDITSGTGGGLFSPAGICTRAQVVTFLYRAFGA